MTIYHGDCREILPTLPKVDLVLTDPPYGICYNPKIHKKYNGRESVHTEIVSDHQEMDFGFLFSSNVNKIIWGAENFYRQIPFRGRWICWYKRSFANTPNTMPSGDFELAWMSKKSGFYKFVNVIHGGVINADSERGNNSPRFHPTQKPVGVMKFCIEQFNESETILDPFMGSGTTLRAAKDLNRKAIGIEIEEKYCEIAALRMSQEVFNLTEKLPPVEESDFQTKAPSTTSLSAKGGE